MTDPLRDRAGGGAGDDVGEAVAATLRVAPFSISRLPRIVFGSGRLRELPAIVRGYGERALIITRPSLVAAPAWEAASRGLHDAGVEVLLASVSGEPAPSLVDGLVARHREEAIDVVVGIGGGSVLDVAKAVAGLLRPGNSVIDHLEGVGPALPYLGPAVPFVAVPTTAGTGSEATKNAVLSVRGAGGFKKSFRDERLVAEVALVDPDLLATCPPRVIAADGMDAVTQLLEAFVSAKATPFTDALALSGLAAARAALVPWFETASAGRETNEGSKGPAGGSGGAGADPTAGDSRTAEARERMAYAALCSGICLAQAGLGAVHGIASPLGAFFPVPHGVACGTLLAAATRVNVAALEAREPGNTALPRYAALGRLLAGGAEGSAGWSDGEARAALVRLLDDWRRRLAIAPLSDFGITAADVASIVAESRGSSMRTNPIRLTDEEIATILRESL